MQLSARAPLLGILFCAQGLSAQQYGLRALSLEEGLPSAGVSAVCEDADGFLWVGTAQGAARSEGLRFEAIATEQGLPHENVTELLPDPDGSIWLGFGNGAVARWDHGTAVRIAEGPGASVRAMAHFNGAIWWASGERLWSWDDEHGVQERPFANGAHGLIRALAVAPGPRLILGADGGLFVLSAAGWHEINADVLPHPRVR